MFKTIVAAVLLLVWLFAFAGDGLGAWFTYDDLMNLYAASHRPLGSLLLDNLCFWRGVARPFADLVNHAAWAGFGFHPAPYRWVCFALLVGNLGLATALMRRLSQSAAVALLGALLFAYQANLSDLYFNSGTIYDLLCFLFFFAATLWYLTLRMESKVPTWAQTAAFAAVALLAMNSKEMAIALPVVLAATEWLYGDRRSWRVVVTCGVVCAFVAWRIMSHANLQANPAYAPVVSWDVYWSRWAHYQRMLLYQSVRWAPRHAPWFLAACVAVAAGLRRKEGYWACVLLFIAPLPILFVPERGLYAFYIPFLGWSLLLASLLGALVRLAWPERSPLAAWGPALAAVALALWLVPQHEFMRGWSYRWYYRGEYELKEPGEAMRRGLPALAPGSRVFFVDDPFPPDDTTTLYYFVTMLRDDHSLIVERAKGQPGPVPEDQWGRYAAVFRLTRSELTRLR